MESSGATSHEKLDQMLADGKISQADYERLSNAMKSKPAEQEKAGPEKRRLHKSWEHRQIGGVCAGIAEYIGLDVLLVRVLFVAIAILLAAAPVVVLVYLLLYYLLPWDNVKAAREPWRQGRRWGFALGASIFLLALPILFGQLGLPRILRVYEDLGTALPSLSALSIHAALAYRIEPHWETLPWGIPISIILIVIASLLYLVCHNRKLRRVYGIGFLLLAAVFPLTLIVGSLFPLWTLSIGIQ
jgi:phage shock protein PspC (stress-responsive transcriptional regulator)